MNWIRSHMTLPLFVILVLTVAFIAIAATFTYPTSAWLAMGSSLVVILWIKWREHQSSLRRHHH